MKKKDLKTGMTVTHKNGDRSLVLIGIDTEHDTNIDCLVSLTQKYIWYRLDYFNDDFTGPSIITSVSDIIAIHSCVHPLSFVRTSWTIEDSMSVDYNKGELLWEREEVKPALTLDGVDYSEDTIRSLIKKATNK